MFFLTNSAGVLESFHQYRLNEPRVLLIESRLQRFLKWYLTLGVKWFIDLRNKREILLKLDQQQLQCNRRKRVYIEIIHLFDSLLIVRQCTHIHIQKDTNIYLNTKSIISFFFLIFKMKASGPQESAWQLGKHTQCQASLCLTSGVLSLI